jgi:thioredoxin
VILAVNCRNHADDSIFGEGGNNPGCRPQFTKGTRRTAMAASGKLTQKKFEQSILHGVTLVDFDAPWCAPCRAQQPIIDTVKKRYLGKAAVKKINIDDNRDIALHLGIQSIPTIIIFKEGKEMNRFIGIQTAEMLNRVLKKLIDQPYSPQKWHHASLS